MRTSTISVLSRRRQDGVTATSEAIDVSSCDAQRRGPSRIWMRYSAGWDRAPTGRCPAPPAWSQKTRWPPLLDRQRGTAGGQPMVKRLSAVLAPAGREWRPSEQARPVTEGAIYCRSRARLAWPAAPNLLCPHVIGAGFAAGKRKETRRHCPAWTVFGGRCDTRCADVSAGHGPSGTRRHRPDEGRFWLVKQGVVRSSPPAGSSPPRIVTADLRNSLTASTPTGNDRHGDQFQLARTHTLGIADRSVDRLQGEAARTASHAWSAVPSSS
jgi:hypothetical protein